ncbi:MAG: hypothetical protein ACOXZ4_03335 [Sphaerochaetaceae bacterium]
MRVCIVYQFNKPTNRSKELLASLKSGFISQGHQITSIDAVSQKGTIISHYDYLILLSSATTWWGAAVSEHISSFLQQAGSIGGKRCSAFVQKKGLRGNKTLQNVMKVMEKEGLFITYSDILENPSHALSVGKRLQIQ